MVLFNTFSALYLAYNNSEIIYGFRAILGRTELSGRESYSHFSASLINIGNNQTFTVPIPTYLSDYVDQVPT